MTDPEARTFTSDFRRFFIRGLVVLLPTVLTLWILVYAYQFVDSAIAEPINRWVRMGMNEMAPYWQPLRTQFDPTGVEVEAAMALGGGSDRATVLESLRIAKIEAWWASRWYMDIIGLLLAIVAVYMVGRLLGGYIGRKLYGRVERLIASIPLFKQVYPYVKQVVDFLFGDDKAMSFSSVVIIEYPRRGIWSIGFRTGGALRGMDMTTGELATVFIPSSPTPFTGYTVTLPATELIDLPITVEEALRFIISGGVLMPTQPPGVDPSATAQAAPQTAAGTGHSARLSSCPPLPTGRPNSPTVPIGTSGST